LSFDSAGEVGETLSVERGDHPARHAAVVADERVDLIAMLGQNVFGGRHRLLRRPALMRLLGDQLETGIRLKDLERAARHRDRVRVAGLALDQRYLALDRSLGGLKPLTIASP
jgi:hypothetical protein